MNSRTRDWLPLQVAGRVAVRENVAKTIDHWRATWFENTQLGAARWDVVAGDVWALGESDGRMFGAKLGAWCGARAALRLAEAALDVELSSGLGDADRRVVDGFIDRLLTDLLRGLEAALGSSTTATASAARRAGPGVRVGVGPTGGGVLFWLVLPMEALMPLCQASLPPPRPVFQRLGERRAALARHELTFEAVLGGAAISLRDLASLTPGDVLVLDRALGEPAALRHVRTGKTVAHGVMEEAGGHAALLLKSSFD